MGAGNIVLGRQRCRKLKVILANLDLKLSLKTKTGQQDGSKTRRARFNPWNPHKGKKEPPHKIIL